MNEEDDEPPGWIDAMNIIRSFKHQFYFYVFHINFFITSAIKPDSPRGCIYHLFIYIQVCVKCGSNRVLCVLVCVLLCFNIVNDYMCSAQVHTSLYTKCLSRFEVFTRLGSLTTINYVSAS